MDDQCVVCQRKVQRAENYVKCHLWGAFATFHWPCFGRYLRVKASRRSKKRSGRPAA